MFSGDKVAHRRERRDAHASVLVRPEYDVEQLRAKVRIDNGGAHNMHGTRDGPHGLTGGMPHADFRMLKRGTQRGHEVRLVRQRLSTRFCVECQGSRRGEQCLVSH